jgi:predicted methyltransferase
MRRTTAIGVLVAAIASGCTSLKRFAYEGFGRDRWQQPERVVRALAVRPGSRVADLGAGGGYFTFRLADAVGPEGVVYAVDVDPGMVGWVRDRAAREERRNVEAILAAPDDPRLPPGGVDLVFTSNTYHHIADRTAYFARVRDVLRPGGRLAVIEYRHDASWLTRFFGHATTEETIRKELETAGWRVAAEHGFLARQTFLVLEARP